MVMSPAFFFLPVILAKKLPSSVGMKITMVLPCLILFCLLFSASEAATSIIQCSDVNEALSPCVEFLRSTFGQGELHQECCIRLLAFADQVKSTVDRKKTCACIRRVYKTLKPDPTVAQNLPSVCKISLPFSLATNSDCNQIS